MSRAPNKNATFVRVVDGIQLKDCSCCKDILSLLSFREDNHLRTGYRSRCKKCEKDSNRAFYPKRYANNRDKIIAQSKDYRAKNKDKRCRYEKKYREDNVDKMKEYQREYRSENLDKINEYHRTRYNTNPQAKIRQRLASRIRQVVKNKSTRKSADTMTLTGTTLEKLIAHMESLFLPGMTWENHGKWHIDHIKPCSSFDLTDPEQQRACFNWSNLQPLWALDNMKKSDKILL